MGWCGVLLILVSCCPRSFHEPTGRPFGRSESLRTGAKPVPTTTTTNSNNNTTTINDNVYYYQYFLTIIMLIMIIIMIMIIVAPGAQRAVLRRGRRGPRPQLGPSTLEATATNKARKSLLDAKLSS